MKTINFNSELEHSSNLQSLKDELQSIGIRAFTINYESQQITVTNPLNQTMESIECAVRKAGFKCSCFSICNHKNDV